MSFTVHIEYCMIVSKETLIVGNERQILQLKQANVPEIPSKVVILCFFCLINTLHLDKI